MVATHACRVARCTQERDINAANAVRGIRQPRSLFKGVRVGRRAFFHCHR